MKKLTAFVLLFCLLLSCTGSFAKGYEFFGLNIPEPKMLENSAVEYEQIGGFIKNGMFLVQKMNRGLDSFEGMKDIEATYTLLNAFLLNSMGATDSKEVNIQKYSKFAKEFKIHTVREYVDDALNYYATFVYNNEFYAITFMANEHNTKKQNKVFTEAVFNFLNQVKPVQ